MYNITHMQRLFKTMHQRERRGLARIVLKTFHLFHVINRGTCKLTHRCPFFPGCVGLEKIALYNIGSQQTKFTRDIIVL